MKRIGSKVENIMMFNLIILLLLSLLFHPMVSEETDGLASWLTEEPENAVSYALFPNEKIL